MQRLLLSTTHSSTNQILKYRYSEYAGYVFYMYFYFCILHVFFSISDRLISSHINVNLLLFKIPWYLPKKPVKTGRVSKLNSIKWVYTPVKKKIPIPLMNKTTPTGCYSCRFQNYNKLTLYKINSLSVRHQRAKLLHFQNYRLYSDNQSKTANPLTFSFSLSTSSNLIFVLPIKI